MKGLLLVVFFGESQVGIIGIYLRVPIFMVVKKMVVWIVSLGILCNPLWAQEVVLSDNLSGGLDDILYSEEWAIEAVITPNGSSLGFYKGELQSFDKTSYRLLSVGQLRHPKEIKQNRQRSSGGIGVLVPGSNYVYGKQNTLLTAKYSFGTKRYLSRKGNHRGIAVGVNYCFGPTLGLLKPYLLDLNVERVGAPGSEVVATRFTEETAVDFLDDSKIRGHSGFFEGWGDLKMRLGAHARGGILLSPGAYDGVVRALEVGLQVDIFTRDAPIMILEKNQFLFINFYASLHLGKRRKF